MANNKPARIISKKHLARLERERRQTRALVVTAIVILVAVVGMIVYGVLYQTVLKPVRRVVRVYDETIQVGAFQLAARLQRQEIINEYVQNFSFALMFGSTDPTNDPNWSDSLQRIETQLYDTVLGPSTMDRVVEASLIRHYAAENGIEITQEDIDQAIREAFRYYPEGTPTPAPTSTPFSLPTLSATERALVTLTPTPTRFLTPTPDPDATPEPAPTQGPAATPTEVPTATPTPTEYTLEGFQSEYQEVLSYYQTELNLSEEEFIQFFFIDPLYRSRVYEIVTADTPHEQEQVWARHILVADEATAQNVRALLLSGEDFAEVAAEYSTDTGSATAGGDLGWFGRGMMVAEFEEAAFSLEIGEISEPVQSQYGYHIIQVVARHNVPMTDSEYKTATDQAFQDWLDAQRLAAEEAGDIVYFIDPAANNPDLWDITPDDPSLDAALNAMLQQMYATPTATP